MAALRVEILWLVLFKAWIAAANTEEWKTATATYTKETDGSIINGNFLLSIYRICHLFSDNGA